MSQNPLLNPNIVKMGYTQIIDNAPDDATRERCLKDYETRLRELGWGKEALAKFFNLALLDTKWYKWQRGRKIKLQEKKIGKNVQGCGPVGYSVPYGSFTNEKEKERQKQLNWTDQDFKYYDTFKN